MIGIVYQKNSNKIIAVIPNVQSYNAYDIEGSNSGIKGIDTDLADFKIVNSGNYKVGDVLGVVSDTRSSLLPSQEGRIAALESAILSLMGL